MMQFALLSAPPDVAGCRLIADLSRKTTSLTVATNNHGMAELQATVNEPSLAAQFRVADRQGLPWVCVSDGGPPIYVGRLEDVTIAGEGLRLGAFGAWRALSDTPYTALWSDTSVAEWVVLKNTDFSIAYEDRFNFDTNNRISISPKRGITYGNSPVILGTIAYQVPSASSQLITNVAFHYAANLPAGWDVGLVVCDDVNNTGTSTVWSVTATGSGLVSVSGFTKAVIRFYMYYNAANAVYGADDGTHYLRITNLRVTTQAAPVGADAIARDLVSAATTLNSGVLSAVTGRIQAPGLDLFHQVYQDADMGAVLDQLAALGDTSQRQWRAWVGADRVLVLEPWGASGRTWYVDVTDLQVQRTLETLANSVYAVYQDASNRTLRTAVSANAQSVSRYGLTRRQALQATTTSATEAAYERDTQLAGTLAPPARAGISFDRIFTAGGARVPLWAVAAGDTFILRNLAPSLSTDVDKIRVIRIGRAVWDVVANTLSVEPQVPLPLLQVLLAQQANRNQQ